MASEPSTKILVTPERAAMSGILGVSLFAATLAFLTVIEYDFMLSIGWKPLADAGGAWPSGLSLGPYGWMMNIAFIVSGLSLTVFAVGLHRGIKSESDVGPFLLSVSGAAMSLMAFETDPILREGPRSLHGWIHDTAFVVVALAFLSSMSFLWREFDKDPGWKPHARYTLATGIIAAACLFLPGVSYYLFVAVLLAWILATAMRLSRVH